MHREVPAESPEYGLATLACQFHNEAMRPDIGNLLGIDLGERRKRATVQDRPPIGEKTEHETPLQFLGQVIRHLGSVDSSWCIVHADVLYPEQSGVVVNFWFSQAGRSRSGT